MARIQSLVNNSQGSQVYYSANVTQGIPVTKDSLSSFTDLVFDTVSDMKSSTTLKDGDKVKWAGYNSLLDGGGNWSC